MAKQTIARKKVATKLSTVVQSKADGETKFIELSVEANEAEMPEHPQFRWTQSRYQMLDGRAMEAHSLIEDAMLEIEGIVRVLNRDTDHATGDHSGPLIFAADAQRALAVARNLVGQMGSELDSMAMGLKEPSKPKEAA